MAEFKVVLPDGLAFQFSGDISLTLSSVEVGSQITFTLTITVNSEIDVTVPTFA